jgi:tripartite-type tricarboxylate transporter receptor subunit TctC
MRDIALLCALAIGLPVPHAGAATVEPYPSRAIKVIVPQPPGAQSDVLGRMLADSLTELWKESVFVENHGGAGGTIGTDLAAKAPADGYTVLVTGLNILAIAPALIKDLRYDPVRDFTPIGGFVRVPYALAVNRKVPASTLAELISYARAHPGQLTYGSGGAGSTSQLGAELMKSMAGIDVVHVPYRGSAPSIKALVSGEIDMMFADLSLLAPHAEAGTLRLLAAAGNERAAAAPDLPTLGEQGLPGFAIEPWYGLVVPVGTPAEVVAKLADGLRRTLVKPELQQHLQQLGYSPMSGTPAEFDALIRSEIEKYSQLIERAGIRGEP